MFTSDEKRILRRGISRCLTESAACAALGLLYEQFSHGVVSLFLVGAFLFPLVGGAGALCALLLCPGAWMPGAVSRKLYGCGLATLTVGSLMTGVFEIYGSAAPLVAVYWYVGAALILGGAAAFWAARPRRDALPEKSEACSGTNFRKSRLF